jgi:hypothetical protein
MLKNEQFHHLASGEGLSLAASQHSREVERGIAACRSDRACGGALL